jgi:hypothetical protein
MTEKKAKTATLHQRSSKFGISCWATLRARCVTLRARCVTLRARWVTLRARWVTLRDLWVDAKSVLGDSFNRRTAVWRCTTSQTATWSRSFAPVATPPTVRRYPAVSLPRCPPPRQTPIRRSCGCAAFRVARRAEAATAGTHAQGAASTPASTWWPPHPASETSSSPATRPTSL